MSHRTLTLAGLLLVAAGCAASPRADELLARSRKDLACPAAQEVDTGFMSVAEVRGCGKANVYLYAGGESAWLSPLDRAPFELSCERSQLTTTILDPKTVGVSGCGKRAVYVAVFPGGDLGKWVLDSVGPEDGMPAPNAIGSAPAP